MLITLATAIYNKHHDADRRNREMRELAHDGNFTLPDRVPAISPHEEAGTHWRFGVDPAAKGAVQHDFGTRIISEPRNRRNSTSSRDSSDSGSTERSIDELWDEVARMVENPTPRKREYSKAGDLKRSGAVARSRNDLQRSIARETSVMSAASTDSWTSKYSHITDERRCIGKESDGSSAKVDPIDLGFARAHWKRCYEDKFE